MLNVEEELSKSEEYYGYTLSHFSSVLKMLHDEQNFLSLHSIKYIIIIKLIIQVQDLKDG